MYIQRRFLAQAVSEAHGYKSTMHKHGSCKYPCRDKVPWKLYSYSYNKSHRFADASECSFQRNIPVEDAVLKTCQCLTYCTIRCELVANFPIPVQRTSSLVCFATCINRSSVHVRQWVIVVAMICWTEALRDVEAKMTGLVFDETASASTVPHPLSRAP